MRTIKGIIDEDEEAYTNEEIFNFLIKEIGPEGVILMLRGHIESWVPSDAVRKFNKHSIPIF